MMPPRPPDSTEQRLARLERRYALMVTWLRVLIDERRVKPWSIRPPMPTLNPDDSGSIDVTGFGMGATFRGRWPVRAAIVAMAIIVVGVAGALVGRALQPGTVHVQESPRE